MNEKRNEQDPGFADADKMKQLGAFLIARRRANYQDLNRFVRPGGVVFAGDSITEHFPIHELLQSAKPMYNRGISGDTTSGMLEHLRHLVLDLQPSQVFLLIGTNDLGEGDAPQEIVRRIDALCAAIQAGAPEAGLTLLAVYPVNPQIETGMPFPTVGIRTNEAIREMNETICERATERQIAYLDLHDRLADESGVLKAEYTYDGLHLNVAGYEVVGAEIQKHLIK